MTCTHWVYTSRKRTDTTTRLCGATAIGTYVEGQGLCAGHKVEVDRDYPNDTESVWVSFTERAPDLETIGDVSLRPWGAIMPLAPNKD